MILQVLQYHRLEFSNIAIQPSCLKIPRHNRNIKCLWALHFSKWTKSRVEDDGFVVGGKVKYKAINVGGATSSNWKSIVLNKSIKTVEDAAFTFIHEILHAAGRKNHDKLVRAIAVFEGIKDDFKSYEKNNKPGDLTYSRILDSWISKYCNVGGTANWEEWLKKF